MAASQADERLLAQLRDRVGQRVTDWRPGARVLRVSPLTGGTSSLTFLVELAGVAAAETPVVLKVAPPGLAPVRNRDVLRQARLQKAVQGRRGALAPDVLFSDPGDPPEVPPFMAMNLVPGECVEPVLCDDAERPAGRPGAGPVLRRRAGAGPAARGSPRPRPGWATSPPSGSPTRLTGGPARSPRCPATWRATTSGPPRRCGRACPRRCRRRSTTATSGSGTPCARATGSTRSSTGRSGRWATRASTWPG